VHVQVVPAASARGSLEWHLIPVPLMDQHWRGTVDRAARSVRSRSSPHPILRGNVEALHGGRCLAERIGERSLAVRSDRHDRPVQKFKTEGGDPTPLVLPMTRRAGYGRHGKGDHRSSDRGTHQPIRSILKRASNKVIGGLMAVSLGWRLGQSGGRRISPVGRTRPGAGANRFERRPVVTAIRCWLQDREERCGSARQWACIGGEIPGSSRSIAGTGCRGKHR